MDIYTSKFSTNNKKKSSYISRLFTRVLISVILFLCSMIFINSSESNKTFYKKHVIDSNIQFNNFTKKYNQVFGTVIEQPETELVFNENLTYKKVEEFNKGYSFYVGNNYLVPTLQSGIIVYIGEKEDYGNTVIVQGVDGVDIWYGNVSLNEYSLYDYVPKGSILAESKGEYINLVFLKNGEYLNYEEYIN